MSASEVNRMANVKSIAHELLAKDILKGFKGKITGDNADYIVGENPENRYFVGKLLPVSDSQTSSWGSDVFIESIGSDFYIAKDEIETAQLTIHPKGDFYYRAYPTLEQQRNAMLKKANELFGQVFSDFDELITRYKEDPSAFSKVKEKLIPVYKKVQLHRSDFTLIFDLGELLKDNPQYGYADANHTQNKQLEQFLNDLQNLIWEDEYCYTLELFEKTTIKDLLTEEDYKKFIKKNAKQGTPIRQNWNVYIDITVKLIKDKYLISVALVNGSQVQSNGVTHKSNKKSDDKPTIETLFNSGMEIELNGASFSPINLDFFADDYKYNSCQKAVGNNCSVTYNAETNSIVTNHLPTFVQKRLLTNDELAVSFQSLIDNPVATLKDIHKKMLNEHKKWERQLEEKRPSLSPVGIKNMQEEIDEFAREIRRFEFGIEIINDYPIIMKSFVNMNRTFLKTSKKYSTWRLFQIVFIVSLVPDIAACDEDVLLDSQKAQTTLNEVSLLYFPTGGGKTEAFLGVLIFNLFFDRYRGKECGVTSILRYPLRLLSVQQVQRLANVLAQAELIRRADASIARTEEFSLGYFVGDANTPNKIEKKNVVKYRTSSQAVLDEERIIDVCPFCGKQTVHLKFDESTYRLVHFCDNAECSSNVARLLNTNANPEQYAQIAERFGIKSARVCDRIPFVSCSYGYTRVESEWKEGVQLHALKEEKNGRKNIYATKLNTEGVLFEFDRKKIIQWLLANEIINADEAPNLDSEEEIKIWFLNNIKPSLIHPFSTIDETASKETYYVYRLIHSISHLLIRAAADIGGLGKDSLSEYIFPGIPAVLIYCQNSQGFNLGSLFNTFEAYFDKWMNKAYTSAQKCIFDPICIERQKACTGCLFVNEVSCQHFNKDLDRALVVGHVDRETQRKTTGFWEE